MACYPRLVANSDILYCLIFLNAHCFSESLIIIYYEPHTVCYTCIVLHYIQLLIMMTFFVALFFKMHSSLIYALSTKSVQLLRFSL